MHLSCLKKRSKEGRKMFLTADELLKSVNLRLEFSIVASLLSFALKNRNFFFSVPLLVHVVEVTERYKLR